MALPQESCVCAGDTETGLSSLALSCKYPRFINDDLSKGWYGGDNCFSRPLRSSSCQSPWQHQECSLACDGTNDCFISRAGGISGTGSSRHSGLAKLPNSEQRTTNFCGAAENLRLDFEPIFFSVPKSFRAENSHVDHIEGLGNWRGDITIRCSVFGVRYFGHLVYGCLGTFCPCHPYFASHPR